MHEMLNIFYIFIIPLIIGGLIRFIQRKHSISWLATILLAAAAFIAYLIAMNPPVIGSELYGIRMMQCICLFNGSLITGCVIRLKNKCR